MQVKIARGLGDRDARAFARIERAVERVAVAGRGDDFVRFANEEYRGVASPAARIVPARTM